MMGGQRVRILAVDDEPAVGRAIKRLLGDAHEVEITTDACAALARIDEGERYDLILCDLMMPRMTGMDLHAALVRGGHSEADRMVFLTGGAFTNRAREFLAHVSNRWLEKPFEAAVLRRTISEVLRLHASDHDGSMPAHGVDNERDGGCVPAAVARSDWLRPPG